MQVQASRLTLLGALLEGNTKIRTFICNHANAAIGRSTLVSDFWDGCS
jgi:hypothetical protein